MSGDVGAGSPITGISHIDLSVRNCEESAQWYADTLGFEIRSRNVNERAGFPWIHLVLPDSDVGIGLVEHAQNTGEPFSELRCGLDHLSFAVSDRAALEGIAERLNAHAPAGVTIVDTGDVSVIVLRDPDGIQIELCVRSPAPAPPSTAHGA